MLSNTSLFFKGLETVSFTRPRPFLQHGRFDGRVHSSADFRQETPNTRPASYRGFTPKTLLRTLFFSFRFTPLNTKRFKLKFNVRFRGGVRQRFRKARRLRAVRGGLRRVTYNKFRLFYVRFLKWGGWHFTKKVDYLHTPGEFSPLTPQPRSYPGRPQVESRLFFAPSLLLTAASRVTQATAMQPPNARPLSSKIHKTEGFFLYWWGLQSKWGRLLWGRACSTPRLIARYSRVRNARLASRRRQKLRNRLRSGLFLLHRFCKTFWGYRRTFVVKNAMRPIAKLYGYKAQRFLHCFAFRLDAVVSKIFKVRRLQITRNLIAGGHIRLNGLVWRSTVELCKKLDVISLSKVACRWLKARRLTRNLRFFAFKPFWRAKRIRQFRRRKTRLARWRNRPIILGPGGRFAILWNMRRVPAQKFFSKRTLNKLTPKVARVLYRSTSGYW